MYRKLSLLLFLLLAPLTIVFAIGFHSQTSGSWFSASTWAENAIPGPDDNVNILSGDVVRIDSSTPVSIFSLVINDGSAGPGVVIGAMGDTSYLNVTDGIRLYYDGEYLNGGKLLADPTGNMYVQIGGNLTVDGYGEYYTTGTTFTALSPNCFNNTCYFEQSGSSLVSTTVSVSNPNIIVSVSGELNGDISNNRWLFFDSANLVFYGNVQFTNCSFRHCDITTYSSSYSNAFSNCHFTDCTADGTIKISGPVAVLDNNNVFANVHVLWDGSLWGNANTNSELTVTGNLKASYGSEVSPGIAGTLDIYLGGNLEVGDRYNANTYFNGARLPSNPQTITCWTDIQVLLRGNFHNCSTSLRLDSDVSFATTTPYTFFVGDIFLDEYRLIDVTIEGGVVTGLPGSGLQDCSIRGSQFSNDIAVDNVMILDNNVLFAGNLSVYHYLQTPYNYTTTLTVYGLLHIMAGASVNPPLGGGGILNFNLRGNLTNDGSIIHSDIVFAGTGERNMAWTDTSIFTSSIIIYCSVLHFCPEFNGTTHILDLDTHEIRGTIGTRFKLENDDLQIQNGWLANADIYQGQTGDKLLYLNNMIVENCSFDVPVIVNGSSSLADNQTEFRQNLSVQGCSLTGANGTAITVSANHVNVANNAGIRPGTGGTLDVQIHGNLTVNTIVGSHGVYDATTTTFHGDVTHLIDAQSATLNTTFLVYDNCTLSLLNNTRFTVDCSQAINLYEGQTILLNNCDLSFATVIGGRLMNGSVGFLTIYSVQLENIDIMQTLDLGDNGNVFWGETYTSGHIIGLPGYASSFRVNGSFLLFGEVIAGTGGTIDAYMFGDISSPSPSWSGTIHLCGTATRNIQCGIEGTVIVDGNESLGYADFSITGENYMQGFTIAANNTMTVPPGASLTLFGYDNWYSGNLVMNGTLTNNRTALAQMLRFHSLELTANSYSSPTNHITGVHTMSVPNHLPSSTGEYWKIQTQESVPGLTADLVFYYNGAANYHLSLYYSNDNGDTWIQYPGVIANNLAEKFISAGSVPLGNITLFALSSVVDDWINLAQFSPVLSNTPLMPNFMWPAYYAATTYYFDVATDAEMQNIIYQSPVLTDTHFQMLTAFSPATNLFWVVHAASSYLGNVASNPHGFGTRQVLGCTLPDSVALRQGDSVEFDMPTYLTGILPDEDYSVTCDPSVYFETAFASGQLSIVPIAGYYGVDTLTVNIGDGYTLLSMPIVITVLGYPHDLRITASGSGIGSNVHIDWTRVPGATYYNVYVALLPGGPWGLPTSTTDNFLDIYMSVPSGFFKVIAYTGTLPE